MSRLDEIEDMMHIKHSAPKGRPTLPNDENQLMTCDEMIDKITEEHITEYTAYYQKHAVHLFIQGYSLDEFLLQSVVEDFDVIEAESEIAQADIQRQEAWLAGKFWGRSAHIDYSRIQEMADLKRSRQRPMGISMQDRFEDDNEET